jgi:hypothetical protein
MQSCVLSLSLFGTHRWRNNLIWNKDASWQQQTIKQQLQTMLQQVTDFDTSTEHEPGGGGGAGVRLRRMFASGREVVEGDEGVLLACVLLCEKPLCLATLFALGMA